MPSIVNQNRANFIFALTMATTLLQNDSSRTLQGPPGSRSLHHCRF